MENKIIERLNIKEDNIIITHIKKKHHKLFVNSKKCPYCHNVEFIYFELYKRIGGFKNEFKGKYRLCTNNICNLIQREWSIYDCSGWEIVIESDLVKNKIYY
jgi:hypothetical protein